MRFTDYDETIGNKLIAFKKEEIKNTFESSWRRTI